MSRLVTKSMQSQIGNSHAPASPIVKPRVTIAEPGIHGVDVGTMPPPIQALGIVPARHRLSGVCDITPSIHRLVSASSMVLQGRHLVDTR